MTPPTPPYILRVLGRKPLEELTEMEFLDDLIAFLQADADDRKFAPPGSDSETFPNRKLNGVNLDLFSLYRSVVNRGGYPTKERVAELKPFVAVNWAGEIFPLMANYSPGHRGTSVGHVLIQHYRSYLYRYELAHPEDIIPVPPQGERKKS
eukprot:CAMPEP_0181348250 /NCGR_PEP_ID=MMETSP1106-20121128/73_1 /TAXON_ID=81844 /ORGANISM="Mantoniella antarctica, Strain SL-175" /LENGTH=150 /DNA_ID=CAMNT_0023460525 /DNA_START=69 /DNA_END=518 /DNA_ORIENTATION=+